MQYGHSRQGPEQHTMWVHGDTNNFHACSIPSPDEGGQFHAPTALSTGNKPQMPSEYETGWLSQYNEVINFDNWVLSQVTYCVEMQCVRHMFMSDWVVRTSASHRGNPGFKCGSQLPHCKIFGANLSPSRQMTGQCLNLENECFLLYYFEFIIHWPS